MKAIKLFAKFFLITLIASFIQTYINIPRVSIMAAIGAIYYSFDFYKRRLEVSKRDVFLIFVIYVVAVVPAIYTKL